MKRGTVRAFMLAVVLVCAVLVGAPVRAELPVELPATVAGIRFENSGGLSYDDLITDLSFRPGDMISGDELGRAVRRIEERGVFSQVTVETNPVGRAVQVTFFLKPKIKVSRVNVTGNSAVASLAIRRRSRIQPGEYLDQDKVSAAADLIKAVYREQGFFHAQVETQVRDRRFSTADVVFIIDEGYRSQIRSIKFHDELPPVLSKLGETLESEFLGRPAAEETFRTLRRRTLALVRNQGYLQATARIDPERDDTGDAALSIDLTLREPLTLLFSGNQRFSEQELVAPLKLDTRTVPFSPNAGRRLCREIVELYEAHGYFFAQANCYEGEVTPERTYYHVDITEGEPSRVEKIEFEGNENISARRLKAAMETKTAGWWLLRRWAPGILQKQVLVNDLAAIEELYHKEGFYQASATFRLEKIEDRSTLAVLISINEGPRSFVRSVEIRWAGMYERFNTAHAAGKLDDAELDALFFEPAVSLGEPYILEDLERAGQELADHLLASGYPNASVVLKGSPSTGSVIYLATPGTFVRVGQIHTAGNFFTHDTVLTSELELLPGEPFDEESRQQTEQALSGLGIFRSVSFEPTDGVYDSPVEDLTIRVNERETGTFDAGLAFDSEDGLHVTTELAQRNLEGLGKTLVFGVDGYFKSGAGLFDAGRARLAYTQPHLLSSDIGLQTEGFIQTSIELFDEFSYDRIGGSSFLLFEPGEKLRLSAGPLAYLEKLYDVDPDVQIGPDDTGTHMYSMLNGEALLDLRDDAFNPRQGTLSSLRLRYASRALGSDVDLAGAYASEVLFTPLSRKLVWMNKIGFSIVEPLDGTRAVPISQRIFLGGRSTVRGYARNSIGPRGELNNVVGGDEGFSFTTELQRDLTEALVLAVFLDGGSAYLRNEGTFTGDPLSLSEMRYSPGIGVRYKTPIGPVLVDAAVPLKGEYGSKPYRLNFGIGLAY